MQALLYLKRGDYEVGLRLGASNFVVFLAGLGASAYYFYKYWNEAGLVGATRFVLGI